MVDELETEQRIRIGGEVLALRIAVAGNPNSGKTTIFNFLTGANQHVGNYPGVTVDKVEGIVHHDGHEIVFLDLPGTYSLSDYSPEEKVATQALLDGTLQAVLYVADSGLLERSLLLAIQIREMGLPMVLACNMMDEVRRSGQDIDFAKLSGLLGVEAMGTVGVKNQGVDEAFHAVERMALREQGPALRVPYGPNLDPALDEIAKILNENMRALRKYGDVSARWMALKLLEQDSQAWEALRHTSQEVSDKVQIIYGRVQNKLGENSENIEDVISEQRYKFSKAVANDSLTSTKLEERLKFTDKLDRVLAHNVLGIIIMLAVLWSMFALVINVGAWPQELLEDFFAFCSDTVKAHLPEGLFRSLLTDGIIAGVGSVLSFVPLIIILFACIAFLEDSGYVARMAYISDRIFHWFGLQGASVMPYIIAGGIPGGCAIPGVMATRTMRSPKEKIATMLTVPYMACGAKIPVLTLLCACFFEKYASVVFVLFSVFGWCMVLLVSLLLRHTLLRGASTPMVMEMPPYRRPPVRTVLLRCWERTWMYMRKAVVVLLPVAVLLWAAMEFPSLPPEKAWPYENSIAKIENQIQVVAKQGKDKLDQLMAKEVGEGIGQDRSLKTLDARIIMVAEALQSRIKNILEPSDEDVDELRGDLEEKLAKTIGSLAGVLFEAKKASDQERVQAIQALTARLNEYKAIKDNLDGLEEDLSNKENERDFAKLEYSVAGRIGRLMENVTAPLGFNWRTDIALLGGIAAKEAIVSTLGTAYSLGRDLDEEDESLREQLKKQSDWNPGVAMALLVFVMLYSPCFVTLGVMKAETGSWKWVVFSIIFNTAIAYGLAYIVYKTYPCWGEFLV